MTTTTYPPAGTRPADHPIAKLFPMMDEAQLHKLSQDIARNGLREPLLLHEGKLLDGRNRWAACEKAKQAPRWAHFDPKIHGESPLAFVMSKNLERRHLTASQRSAIAAEALPLFEKEARERQKAGGKQQAANLPNVAAVKPAKGAKPAPAAKPAAPAKEPAKGKGKAAADLIPGTKVTSFASKPPAPAQTPTPKGKATEQAGKLLGVSGRAVQDAKALKKAAPKKLEEVKAGKKSLAAAKKETAMEAADVQTALGRIRQVCGKGLAEAAAEGTRLKGGPKEILHYASLSDDEMLRLRGLIESGWDVKKALGYKTQAITRAHRVGDLLDRAAANSGVFNLDIDGWEISVKKAAAK